MPKDVNIYVDVIQIKFGLSFLCCVKSRPSFCKALSLQKSGGQTFNL